MTKVLISNRLLNILFEKGITDVLVEGGSELNGSFLRAGLINKFLIYVAPKILGGRHSLLLIQEMM